MCPWHYIGPRHHRAVLAAAFCFVGLAIPAGASVIDINGYRFDPLLEAPSIPPSLLAAPAADRATYLLQFSGPVEEEWKSAVQSDGATLADYIPENAFVARMDGAARARVLMHPFVAYLGPYHTAYRLSPGIGKVSYRDPERRDDPLLTLRVRVIEDLAGTAVEAARLGELIEVIEDAAQPGFVIHIDRTKVEALASLPAILWIEERPETFVLNNTTKWVIQSNQSGVTPIWDKGIYGEGQILCEMDTGLDYNSCWFRDTGNAPPGPNHRKVIDYRTWGGNAYDGCDTGHGTHVAGTAVGDQSFINPGNFGYNGMAYKAKIMIQDVGDDGFFACLLGLLSVPGSLGSAFNDAFAKGARVHTNSWGSTANAYDSYSVDVDNFMWSHKDFLVCFANGNSGPGGSTVSSPATAKNCVSVGATQQAPNQENVASYSSRGPASDGRLKPTVTAPGGESPTYINSANNDPGDPPGATCSAQGNPFQGTSMATPAVAGAALLVRDYFARGFYPDGEVGGDAVQAPAALVKAMLVNSGKDMAGLDQPNNNEGWGRLLLNDALFFKNETRELRVENETVGLATGEEVVYTYAVDSASEPLEITLVWTDYPAAQNANPALVNNLNLSVLAPNGDLYLGNVYSGGQSTIGGAADARNVEECVRRTSPLTGQWAIKVRAANVPQGGRQPFAVVSTGAFGNWPENPAAVGVTPTFAQTSLDPARPNPSTGETTLRFVLAVQGPVTLSVHDVDGRRVARLVDTVFPAGAHSVVWSGRGDGGRQAEAGVYFYRLQAAGTTITRKMTRL